MLVYGRLVITAPSTFNILRMSQKTFNAKVAITNIFLAIIETGQKFGIHTISKIVSGNTHGENMKKIKTENLKSFRSCPMYSTDQVRSITFELLEQGYIERNENKFKSLRLTPKAFHFLQNPVDVNLSEELLDEAIFSDKVIETQEETQLLLDSGLSPQEIAEKRNMSLNTILHHIANLMYHKRIKDTEKYLPKEKQELMKDKIAEAMDKPIKEIKKLMPESISYSDIKMMLAQVMQPA